MISIDMFVSRFFAEIEKFKFDMIEVRNDVLLLILRVLSSEIDKSSKPTLKRILKHASLHTLYARWTVSCTDQLVSANFGLMITGRAIEYWQ